MLDPEFHVQTFRTPAQWRSGLPVGLDLAGGGISLFATPTFDRWLHRNPVGGDIVTDACGHTWWTARDPQTARWTLFRHDPVTNETERVVPLDHGDPIEPRKLWLTRDFLLVYDAERSRLLALSREHYQILLEVFAPAGAEVLDMEWDGEARVHALIRREQRISICRRALFPSGASDWRCLELPHTQQPVALAVAPSKSVYVLDAGLGLLLRLRSGVTMPDVLAASSEPILRNFQPAVFQSDPRGVLFLAGAPTTASAPVARLCAPGTSAANAPTPAKLYQFDADGSFLGELRLPAEVTAITGIGFDGHGGVYLATNLGLARYSLSRAPVGQAGTYYARALDNGEAQALWHRFEFTGDLPLQTSVEVFYHAADNPALKQAHDAALASTSSTEEKQRRIENLLGPLWHGPEVFRGQVASPATPSTPVEEPHDLLFLHNRGRFLYFKLVLKTFDEQRRPSVRTARILHPRRSYLRYLPPAYSEDPVSAAFLERFLSLFETIFQGLDEEITTLFRYFDPQTAPADFLPWLASWVSLTLDEDLPTDRIRELIRHAPELFSRKGTPAALTRFLEIYTGRPVLLLEAAGAARPLVLGTELPLGLGTILNGARHDAVHVGDTSRLGYAVLRSQPPAPHEAFLFLAGRFSLWLDLPAAEFARRHATLRRVVDELKPAHTVCAIGLLSQQNRLGQARLGLNTTVTAPQPIQLRNASIGDAVILARGRPTPRVDRTARLGGPERL